MNIKGVGIGMLIYNPETAKNIIIRIEELIG